MKGRSDWNARVYASTDTGARACALARQEQKCPIISFRDECAESYRVSPQCFQFFFFSCQTHTFFFPSMPLSLFLLNFEDVEVRLFLYFSSCLFFDVYFRTFFVFRCAQLLTASFARFG